MYHSSKGCQLETMTMGQLMEHGAAQFFKSGVKKGKSWAEAMHDDKWSKVAVSKGGAAFEYGIWREFVLKKQLDEVKANPAPAKATGDTELGLVEWPTPPVKTLQLKWEYINVAAIGDALKRSAVLQSPMPSIDMFQVLYNLRLRAVDVRRGVGRIAVLQQEPQLVFGKFQARFQTGIKNVDPELIPAAVKAELTKGVPSSMAGTSIFECLI